MLHKAWNSKGEMPYCFPRSSVKFQGHTVQNITDFDPNWVFPDYRPVAAFKSLRFALLFSCTHAGYVGGYSQDCSNHIANALELLQYCNETYISKIESSKNAQLFPQILLKNFINLLQDVLIIHQFLQPDGQVLPKKVTGLCDKAHSKLFKLALQAQEAGRCWSD